MIRKIYQQTRIVQSHNPEKVEAELNALMEEHADQTPEISSEGYHPKIGHFAKVRWTVDVAIPEDARDRAKLDGINLFCGECPFYIPKEVRGRSAAACQRGKMIWFEHAACDEIYELLEKGEIKMLEKGEIKP